MTKPADRMSRIDSSGIRKVFNLAARMTDPVNLSIGQPDFDVPEEAQEAAVKAIRQGFNRYTPTQGIPELHQAVRDYLRRTHDWSPDGVLITSGVSGGILLALTALVNPGDEVVIPDPYFVMYRHLTGLLGGVPVFVDTYPDFRLTAQRIEKVLTPKSKALFINSPCNPTGMVSTREELKEIADLARRRGLLVISDEVYCDFCYDRKFASVVEALPEALLLGGFSKSYAFTGWRLGYACGPAWLVEEMTKLQQYSFVCAPSMVQVAGVEALKLDVSGRMEQYRLKRDMMCQGLKDRFELTCPEGAFYMFPRTPWGTDAQFVQKVIESNCLVIPGSVFSERHTHFRLSYATDDRQLLRGIEILNQAASNKAM